MTALTVNGSAAAATTLATAGKLFNATGGTSGNTSTKVGTSTQFKQIFAKGTTTNQTGVASIPAPTDSNFNGWMWDVTTLEGQEIAAGTWTPTFHLLASTSTTITPTVAWYKRSSAGAYTSIGSVAGSSIALTTSSQALTFTPPSLALMDFATGDKLVMWLWVNQTAGGATNSTISVVEATSASSAGVASQVEAVTPGYAPTPGVLIVTMAGVGTMTATLSIPVLVVYGSSVADTTLTTACQMASASGGVETSKATVGNSGSGNFIEVTSKGNALGVAVAAISAPTGNGWIYYPGAGTFLAGNWALVLTYAVPSNNAGNQTFRVYQLSGGVYTAIGTILFTATATAKTTYSPAAVSMPSTTFGASDGLYFDLWYQNSFGAVSDNPTIYESTSSTAGVSSDMQVTTAVFTPAGSGVALSTTCVGVGTLTMSAPSLSTSLTAECDGVSVLTPALSANLALPSVTLSGAGTLTATPAPLTTAISVTLTGVGTLAETFTLTTALSTTLAGAGTLSGTLSASLTMPSVTLVGVGTLSGTVTKTTALAITLASSGILSGTLSAALTLPTISMAGVGTLSGTIIEQVALAVTLAGVGTLSSSATLTTALSTAFAGAGVLSGTLSSTGGVSLTCTMAGIGVFTPAAPSQSTALSVTSAGTGALSGTFSLSASLVSTLAGNGTLSGTPTLHTSLATTFAGVGTLIGATGLATSLSTTLVGVGTLTATLSTSGNVALSTTLVGSGTLTATPTLKTSLTSTVVGIGILASTLMLSTSLTSTVAGASTLTGAFSLRVALFLSCLGISTLRGTLTVRSPNVPGTATVLDQLVAFSLLGDTLISVASINDQSVANATLTDKLG